MELFFYFQEKSRDQSKKNALKVALLLLAFFAFCTIGVLQFQISERDKEIETLKSQDKIQIFNQKLDIKFLTNQVFVQTQKVNDQEKELKLLKDQINFLNRKGATVDQEYDELAEIEANKQEDKHCHLLVIA